MVILSLSAEIPPVCFAPYVVRMGYTQETVMTAHRETTVGSTRQRPENEPRINRPTPLPLRRRKRPVILRPGRHRRRQLLCAPVHFGMVRRLWLEKTADPGRRHDGR